ncbi:MAG: ABC transporter substrate-binding protein [Anaerolineales bacterium]
MKKYFSAFFLFVFFLSACGGATPPAAAPMAEQTPSVAAEKTLPVSTSQAGSRLPVQTEALKGIRVTVWTPWYGVESSLFDALIQEFNKKNEWGIVAAAEHQVNFSNLYENVNAALPTENKPNAAVALPEQALTWYEQRAVVDLTPYVEDPLYGLDAGDIPAVFLNQDVAGGARAALPAQRDARLFLWNETWAGELGFDAPPAAPDDFRQQACRAHSAMTKDDSPQNDSYGGWLVDTQPMTAYAWLLAFEGGVLEGGDYRFLTPNNIKAFTFVRELSEQGCAWQAQVSPADALANRQALMVSASLGDLPKVARAFAAAGSSDRWRAAPFPGGAVALYGSSYVIFDSSAEKELATWLFIRWLLDAKQDARFVEATHLFPIRAATLSFLGDYEKTHPQWRQAVDLIPQGEMQPQLSSWREVKVMLGDGFTHMYRVNVPSGQVPAILAQMETLSRELGR